MLPVSLSRCRAHGQHFKPTKLGIGQWDVTVLLASNESLPLPMLISAEGLASAATAACVDLPDADMWWPTAAFSERVAGRSLPCCLRAALCAKLDLAAVLHSPEQFCGTAGFTVFVKRAALTEEKRRSCWVLGTPVFFTSLPQKDTLLGAGLILRSVTTGESPVLYVSVFFFSTFSLALWCP